MNVEFSLRKPLSVVGLLSFRARSYRSATGFSGDESLRFPWSGDQVLVEQPRMMKWNSFASVILSIASFFFLNACSLEPKSGATLHLSLAELRAVMEKASKEEQARLVADQNRERDDEFSTVLAFPTQATNPTPSPPSGVVDFTCFAVNVMGPGIPSSEAPDPNDDPPDVRHARAVAGMPTAYKGITSGAFSLSSGVAGSVDVNVPAGSSRVVQVIGLKALSSTAGDPIYDFCTGAVSSFPTSGSTGDGYFIVAQSHIPSAFGDLSVTMSQDYIGRPNWYKEYKRIKGQGNCRVLGGKFKTGAETAAGGGPQIMFAYGINPGATFSNPVKMNRFRVQIVGAGSNSNISAKIYTSTASIGTGTFVGQTPTVYSNVYSANESYLVNAAQASDTYDFTFSNAQIPSNTDSYFVVYGDSAFNLMGESTGLSNAPMGVVSYWDGSVWTSVGATNPYVSIETCF